MIRELIELLKMVGVFVLCSALLALCATVFIWVFKYTSHLLGV